MDYPVSLETWPKRGSLRSGAVSARRMSERPTVESGCSSWPTATVNGNYNRKGLSPTSGDGLATAVAQWPTPDAQAMERYNTSPGPAGPRPTLAMAIRTWPTPTVNDSKNDNPPSQAERNTPPLNVAACNWPTPRAEDSESTGAHGKAVDTLTSATRQWQTPATDSFRSRGGARRDEMGLDQRARMWATPRSSPQENRATRIYGTNTGIKHAEGLAQQAGSFHPDRGIVRGGLRTPSGVVLNPRFVEALMGFPDGMTGSTPLEMQSFHSWLGTHSQRLRVLLDSTSKARRTA